jgi:uncharacterized membrane protein
VGGFFAAAYLLTMPLGESKLIAEFLPTPPWKARSGQTLQLSIRITNNGGQFAVAKNVQVYVLTPENFLVHESRTNEYSLRLDMLRGGELQEKTFNMTVPPMTSSGIYNITARVSADYISEQTLTAQVNVTQQIP